MSVVWRCESVCVSDCVCGSVCVVFGVSVYVVRCVCGVCVVRCVCVTELLSAPQS